MSSKEGPVGSQSLVDTDWESESSDLGGAGERGAAKSGGSRLSKHKRHGDKEPGESADSDSDGIEYIGSTRLGAAGLLEMGDVPASTMAGDRLREECVVEDFVGGEWEARAKTAAGMLNEWRSWMDGYEGAYIEAENGAGEVKQWDMLNSYHEERANKHYARVKGLEREIEASREWSDSITTVMLTFTASNRREDGGMRAVGDHMRDIVDGGWESARKMLNKALSGFERSCKIRIWEPHKSGYGHMHVAVFIDDEGQEVEAADFEGVMASHVDNCKPAGRDAHHNEACDEHYEGDDWGDVEAGCNDCHQPVSVSYGESVENLASYVCEYIAQFGESWDDRELSEQMFLAASWATNTRRFNPDREATTLMQRDLFRQATGADPERYPYRFKRWKNPDKDAKPEQYNGNSEEDAHGGISGVTIDPEAEEVVVHGDSESGDESGESGGGGEGEGECWSLTAIGQRREGQEDDRAPPPEDGGGGYMKTIDGGPDHQPIDAGSW